VPQNSASFGIGTLEAVRLNSEPVRANAMPSLLRLLTVLAIIFAIGYGVMYALATFVSPKSREISVTVPPDKFIKHH
jgi:hypothetical protein